MIWDSIIQVLSGPLLAKIALAAVIGAVFLFLRRAETEGFTVEYVYSAVLLAVRDILYAIFPFEDLFRVSDLLLFALLFHATAAFFVKKASLIVPLAIASSMALLLSLKAIFGFAPAIPSELFRLFALVPALASFVFVAMNGSGADESGPLHAYRSRFPLAAGSVIYIISGTIFGPASFIFQALIVPVFYFLLIGLAVIYEDGLRKGLVGAVSYYEESIDSLYDLLSRTGESLKAGFSLQDLLDGMAGVVEEKTNADGVLILLAEEEEESFAVRALHGHFPPPFKLPESLPRDEERVTAHLRHARVRIGEGLLGETAQIGSPLFIPDASADARIAKNGEEAWLKLRSLLAAPLVVRDRVIGLLVLARIRDEAFDERDFDRLKLLADFGSIAVANSFSFLEAAEQSDIDREAAIAEGIQRTLSPSKIPDVGPLTFSAFTDPARGVCSDYYDVIRTGSDRCVVAMGDVAGKGVAASLVMVMMRSILQLITNSTKDTATLLTWVNRGIAGKIDMDHFATLGLISIDASSGELEFANAAHQPVLIYRKDSDAIETVDIKSIPIGVERATQYAAKRFKLRTGDVLVLYTDGIVEAMNENGKQFGRKNLGSAILRSRDLAASKIAEAIRDDVREFAGRARRHDDQSVLVVRAKI